MLPHNEENSTLRAMILSATTVSTTFNQTLITYSEIMRITRFLSDNAMQSSASGWMASVMNSISTELQQVKSNIAFYIFIPNDSGTTNNERCVHIVWILL